MWGRGRIREEDNWPHSLFCTPDSLMPLISWTTPETGKQMQSRGRTKSGSGSKQVQDQQTLNKQLFPCFRTHFWAAFDSPTVSSECRLAPAPRLQNITSILPTLLSQTRNEFMVSVTRSIRGQFNNSYQLPAAVSLSQSGEEHNLPLPQSWQNPCSGLSLTTPI
jgi:hypothetical protein